MGIKDIVTIAFLILSSTYYSVAQKAFCIKGSFKTDYNGKICLIYGDKKDTVTTINGRFEFNGIISLPVNAGIQVETGRNKETLSSKFYIDPTPMTISIDTATRVYGGQPYFLAFVKVEKGGKTFDLINNFKNGLAAKVKGLTDADERRVMYLVEIRKFVLNHKNKMASVIILSEFSHLFSGEELKTYLKNFDSATQQTTEAQKIKAAILKDELALIGTTLRDFSQKDQNGKSITLSSLQGKYVLVDFWASWCLPCRAENPNLLKAYHKFKDKGFEILGVSLDQDKVSWLKAINDDQLPWLQVSDLQGWKNEVSTLFKINSIPDSFLIDRNGKIVAKGLRGAALEKKLAELLGEG